MCFDIANHSLLNHGSWLYQRSVRSAASSTESVKRIQQVTQLIIATRVKKSYQLKAQLLKMSYYQPNYYFGQNPYQWQVSQQQEHAGRPNDGPHPTSQAFPVNGYDMNEDSDTSDTVEPVLVSVQLV